VSKIARKVCDEIGFSFRPATLYRWVVSNKDNEGRLAEIFNLSALLSRHIPDFSTIGAYSKSKTAGTFREATEGIPRLLLMSTFGDSDLANNMRFFFQHLEESQKMISENDLKMSDHIVTKDQGPFLYWLITERPPSRCSA